MFDILKMVHFNLQITGAFYPQIDTLIEGTLDYQQQFIEEIPPELLERHSQTERKRHYPDSLTFWAFFSQVASDDASCAAVVADVQAWAEQRGLPVPSQNTGAYCQARADLSLKMLQEVKQSLYGSRCLVFNVQKVCIDLPKLFNQQIYSTAL